MFTYSKFLPLLLLSLFCACTDTPDPVSNEIAEPSIVETTQAIQADTGSATMERKGGEQEEEPAYTGLERRLKYLEEEWAEVPNPFVAKYVGNEFGDYFHLLFEDAEGRIYDFGDGSNEFGEYEFYSGDHYIDNPDLLQKTFSIDWDWKLSKFLCCEGEMSPVAAKVPSIMSIKIIK